MLNNSLIHLILGTTWSYFSLSLSSSGTVRDSSYLGYCPSQRFLKIGLYNLEFKPIKLSEYIPTFTDDS